MDLYDELRRSVEALNAGGVRYALVGGLAVSIYAAPRATEDIDLLLGSADLDAAVAVLENLGFRRAGAPIDVARGRIRIHRLLKIDGADLVSIDLLVAQDIEIARMLDERIMIDWDGHPTAVVSVSGLRALKKLRGSPQDLADLDALGPE
jgi:hypothetical protein